MPPKKIAAAKTATGAGDETGKEGGKFHWTAENERKLLLFTHPFATITTAEFEKLLEHFPGTNMNGIKIRYSRLRGEKNKLAEKYGFTGMGNGATTGKDGAKEAPKKGKKRGADDEEGTGTSAKKSKRGKMVDDEAPDNDLGYVKKEEDDDFFEI